MGTVYRVVMGLAAVVGCTGLGVVLWTVVAPDESRRKEMAKQYPESNPQLLAERRQQNALVMAVLKEAAETSENVAKMTKGSVERLSSVLSAVPHTRLPPWLPGRRHLSSEGTMSPNASDAAPPAPRKSAFSSCWSCRLLSGAALMGSGFWVYLGPRRVMQQRVYPNMWHITQMTFAVGLICWGVVVITNPVGKLKK